MSTQRGRCRAVGQTVRRLALCLGLWAAAASARAQAPADLLPRADRLYRLDRLLDAEPFYRLALDTVEGADRRRCFDQLLAIYVRVGRQDQAIQTGLRYDSWLRRIGDLKRARELALDLGSWYIGLGHYAASEPYLHRALADLAADPLPPSRRISTLSYLALAAEKQGDTRRAGDAWREVEQFARVQLDGPGQTRDPQLRIECTRRLADSYRFQGRSKEAIGRLEPILKVFDDLKPADPLERRDTLRQLAGHLTAVGRYADAEKRLRQALALHEEHGAADLLTRADLSCDLGDLLERQGHLARATPLRQQAARDYQTVLEGPQTGRPEAAGALAAFWKLHVLFQRTGQLDRALKLTQEQTDQWGSELIEPRLHAEQGRLQVLLGDYAPSRRLLDGAVRDLEKQSPVNLIDLPAALLNLGVAELATGGRHRATELGNRCRTLYDKHRLPPDLVLVETYNLLGTCAAQDGNYQQGIAFFREGAALCVRLGPAADPQRSNLLLNIALLHKSQGDLDRALTACQEARKIYERFAVPDALGFAALDAATAALLVARIRLDEANTLADEILRRCRLHGIDRGPLVLTARHCQGLFQLQRGNFADAERAWNDIEKLHGPKSPLRPRTLNYQALTRELQGRNADAETLYREALGLHRQSPRAFPVVHFMTLWRLANVADRGGKRAEARALLEEAIGIVEKARMRTYGDSEQRALFFAQFEAAFEQLVAWCVRDGDVPGAVGAAARSRSRTLLDQLLLANVDPRKSLRGPRGEALLKKDDELRRRIAALRGQIQLVREEDVKSEAVQRKLADLEKAQQEFTEVFREILNLHPVYRSLTGQQFAAADLDRLRDRALGSKNLLLVYHVGRRQSYLLLLGGRKHAPEAFALTVPEDIAKNVAPPPAPSLEETLGKTRGIVLRAKGAGQPPLPALRKPAASVPLGQQVLRALVGHYLEQIGQPGFEPARGVYLRPRDPARPPSTHRPELLADVLLPAAARARIRQLAPQCLIVVPDGALHKLPFEALVLQAGSQPVYALDALPPMAYAPSVAILALLADPARRGGEAPRGPRSLLTVADPAYPKVEKKADKIERPADPPDHPPVLGLWSRFRSLPGTRVEADAIQKLFPPERVTSLRGMHATEKEVVGALAGRHVVHIAVHGLAFDDLDKKLFGALLLTPPSPGRDSPEDDGILMLHEIYTLPLKRCELAVLSACVTNFGPQPALEAGVTLAGGFLSAGAGRVVASCWGVDDEATAELMRVFFAGFTAADRPAGFAQALQQARRRVRAWRDADGKQPWAAPYYWAPFVLVGPAD
ncbi:MAG: CHAT domain-containing protein [Gemmataceae bacterium]|nr:CHAT domain-containing protein [Gemmataceae bacterium]